MTVPIGELNVPVTQVELQHGISAGIRLNTFAVGLVPIHEEHEARLERNISLEFWGTMHHMEKALIIANRRNRIAMKNLQEEAVIEKSKRDAKKK